MSADFAHIKAGIKAIVAADTDLAGTGQVFDYEPNIETVAVDPFAVVITSGNESEFETTLENKRTYGFDVRIFVERKSRGSAAAEQLITAIVDRLVQAFDENYSLGVSGVIFTKAAPSSWGYLFSDKEYRFAEIKLSTIVSVDVS
jgi:hypothetical protein